MALGVGETAFFDASIGSAATAFAEFVCGIAVCSAASIGKLAIKEKVQGRTIGSTISLAPNIGPTYHSDLRTLNEFRGCASAGKKKPRAAINRAGH
jgi:hypothetical protein